MEKEKRESKRQRTLPWGNLYARARIGEHVLKLPVLDISIGGLGVLVSDGYSLLQQGKDIHIETLENKGKVIATDIHGKVAYLGTGVPSRVGIDFAPAETPIEAYAALRTFKGERGGLITDKEEIFATFNEVKKWSRGFGDLLMMHKRKAIPAEFFYLRPDDGNMVLRIVRVSEFRLPFQPEVGTSYPFYLFKGVNVMLFHARILDTIKNIMETSWPDTLQHISRRSVLRYFITGEQPMTATIVHPITMDKSTVFIWDLSVEGMGAEVMDERVPIIEGMNLPTIQINLPLGAIETTGVVRSVRRENVLEKTQLGIEFINGTEHYRDKILDYILGMDLIPETLTHDA
jgi:c-di-GMP-binding flagellar brake protein YcgR